MSHMQQRFEESRALIDEERIAALLADLHTLLTEDEQSKVRECARLSIEQQVTVAEIGVEAARRHADTDAEEVNRREAVARYFMLLLIQHTEEAATENMIEM